MRVGQIIVSSRGTRNVIVAIDDKMITIKNDKGLRKVSIKVTENLLQDTGRPDITLTLEDGNMLPEDLFTL